MSEEGDVIQICEDLNECELELHNCDSSSLEAQLGYYFATTSCENLNRLPHIDNDDYRCNCKSGFENVQYGVPPGTVSKRSFCIQGNRYLTTAKLLINIKVTERNPYLELSAQYEFCSNIDECARGTDECDEICDNCICEDNKPNMSNR